MQTSPNAKTNTQTKAQTPLSKIYFLNMQITDAMTLCGEMLEKYALVCEKDGDICATIYAAQSQNGTKENQARFSEFVAWCKGFFGANVLFGDCLDSIALERLKAQNLMCATAESCTGGLLAYHFTRNAGASAVFLGGVVSYDNSIKQEILGVRESSLQDFGAVSEKVVSEMLHGVIDRFGAQVALASSGIAGPSGGSAQKPVGCVFLGVQKCGEKPLIEQYFFTGTREQIQEQSCQKALEMLLKII